MIDNLIDQLKRDEGEVLHVYRDSRGILTAGVGHNCEAHNEGLELGDIITQEQSDKWLADDLAASNYELAIHCPWTSTLDPIRLACLQNQCFNMGWGDGKHGLSSFNQYLSLVESHQYDAAANDELHTLWAREVGKRARRLAQQMRTGQWV